MNNKELFKQVKEDACSCDLMIGWTCHFCKHTSPKLRKALNIGNIPEVKKVKKKKVKKIKKHVRRGWGPPENYPLGSWERVHARNNQKENERLYRSGR